MNEMAVGLLAGALFILIGLVGGGFTVREIHIPVVATWTRAASIIVGVLFIGLPLAYSNFSGESGNGANANSPTQVLSPTPTPDAVTPTVPISTMPSIAVEATPTPNATPIPGEVARSPSAVAPTSPPPQSLDLVDISGRWDTSSDGCMEFTRSSPLALGYSFQEYDARNGVIGGGNGLLEGNTLTIFEDAHSDFIGSYSGELQVAGNNMTGVLNDSSGTAIPVRFTGTPIPLPSPSPQTVDESAPSPSTRVDLNGQWEGAAGGYVEFRRSGAIGGGYTFKEHSHNGSVIGEGSGLLEGNTLTIFEYAHNDFIGEYSAVLRTGGNQLNGTITSKCGNETPVVLSKSS